MFVSDCLEIIQQSHNRTIYDLRTCKQNPPQTSFVICILNVGLFCFINKDKNISFNPNEERTPVFIQAENDSLLIFIYLLTEYLSEEKISSTMRHTVYVLFKCPLLD